MTVNGNPIDEYHFLPAPGTITYSLGFEMQQARVSAGLSLEEWNTLPGDPIWTTDNQPVCKAELLIWFRMAQRIPAVSNDLQARELKRQQQRNRLKG